MSIYQATTEIAAALNIDAGTALIRQRVYVYSMEGPLYYQDYWIPPDVPEIVIDTALDNLAEI
jgi:DNA-binding GntR family transcriptional regulator